MIGSISLVHGFLLPLVVALAGVSLLLLLGRRDGAWKRQLLIGVPITAALVGVVATLVDGFALIPYQFPNSYYFWFGLIILGIAFSIIGWRSFAVGRRTLSAASLVLTVTMAVMLVNAQYQYYPTVASAFGGGAHRVSGAQLEEAAAAQDAANREASREELEQARIKLAGGNPAVALHGTTLQVPIPGVVSGFNPRDAYVWLPPAWFTQPLRKLPVVELIAGVPGTPADWTRAGFANQTASEFAQAHNGVAPILVMPDANGSDNADTECVDSSRGNADTYLSVDVPAYVRSTFDAKTGPDSLAIGGLSAGGMCATMLALRHPAIYSTFADYAGLTSPTVGETVDPQDTINQLFNGSSAAYAAHDPLQLLASKSYPGMAGWFEVGTEDSGPLAAQRQLAPLARQAGIGTTAIEVPGGAHNFDFFARAFADSLPFLSYRLGLTGSPAGLPT
ncbi:alpha/beta hydrolase [Jatrophihabitans sp. DSM 45814]